MKLFLPSARATNLLLIVGFGALGYALYLRYRQPRAVERRLGLCRRPRHLDVLEPPRRRASVPEFGVRHSARWRWPRSICGGPSLILFALALALACLGVVLYNAGLSSLAVGLLLLSFARPAPGQA